LARIRLADGAVIDSTMHAFPLEPSRCHAVTLARPQDSGALGWICGEPRGTTAVYRWDAPGARMIELRRFDVPREVLSFGNGALAARGPCARDAAEGGSGHDGRVAEWCIMPPGRDWSDARFVGEDAESARVVVLADARVALVRPPRDGDLSMASLTVSDGPQATHRPIRFAEVRADVARALRLGVWLDGFEERRPGVLGGWVDVAGAIVGIEVGLDGEAHAGEYIRDAGSPVAAGRWAFGWTASRRGFESTDGGMTWTKEIEMPDPIAPARAVRERVCGPIGCAAAGWLRIGWGAPDAPSRGAPVVPHTGGAARMPPSLRLDCVAAPSSEGRASTQRLMVGPAGSRPPAAPSGSTASRFGMAVGPVSQFPPYCGRVGPSMRSDDRGFALEVSAAFERTQRAGWGGMLYTWGPTLSDWDPGGHLEIRWRWPWRPSGTACASSAGASPWPNLEGARRGLGLAMPGQPAMRGQWVLMPGDDADHALLVARHTTGKASADVYLLENGRAPEQARRPGADPFAEIQGAIRIGERWYIATAESPSELPATLVWELDSSSVVELARLPRAGVEPRSPLRLARTAGGRALGLVAEGQPKGATPGQAPEPASWLWVASVDLETGAVTDPEPLAPVSLGDRPLALCSGDDTGWILDIPYPGSIEIAGSAGAGSLQSIFATVHLSPGRACIERLLGSTEGRLRGPAAPGGGAAAATVRETGTEVRRAIEVAVETPTGDVPLRCSLP
jgi:hypothetical protein